MGRARTFTRRAFLSHPLPFWRCCLGAYMVARPHDNPLAADLKDGEATFNPFVKITSDAITLVVPHADKGQGVQSSQAALIAEELDVELDQVTLSFGHPSPAYYNTAFAAEGVPFMSFDESGTANAARAVAGGALKVMGLQGTGGSTSMPDSFDKLRMAGAVARETLKQAAAAKSGVDIADLKTANGAVQLPDGTSLTYQSLAETAAAIPSATEVTLRDPSTWRLIGKPMMRTDIVAKSTGTLPYGIDLTVPDMVHAAVRLNPRRGTLNSYNGDAAMAMRGVAQVLPVTNGVAVVANNTWRAIQAVNAVDCDWAAADYPATMDGHWDTVAASFTPKIWIPRAQ